MRMSSPSRRKNVFFLVAWAALGFSIRRITDGLAWFPLVTVESLTKIISYYRIKQELDESSDNLTYITYLGVKSLECCRNL